MPGIMPNIWRLRRGSESSRLAGLALTGLALLFCGVILTLLFGIVRGEEFSPDNFRRRSFYYFQIPLLGVQVSPVVRVDSDESLSEYLQQHELISSVATSARWDVVYRADGYGQRHEGFAYNLCAYLQMTDEKGRDRWLVWTQDHGPLAKVLWPMVARMAAEKLYFAVPEMMELAKSASDPERLRSRLESIASQAREIADDKN